MRRASYPKNVFSMMSTRSPARAIVRRVDASNTWHASRKIIVNPSRIDPCKKRPIAQWIDLLALEESEGFYRHFDHRPMPGYRIHPG